MKRPTNLYTLGIILYERYVKRGFGKTVIINPISARPGLAEAK